MQAYLHIDHLLLQRHYRKAVKAQEGFAAKLVLRIGLMAKTPEAILSNPSTYFCSIAAC